MKNMRIDIKSIRAKTIIGVHDWERKTKQPVIIDIGFTYDADQAIRKDTIKEAVDYKTLTHKIAAKVEKTKFYLIEKLAQCVLDIILEHPKVNGACVSVSKPGALRKADTVSATLMYRWDSRE